MPLGIYPNIEARDEHPAGGYIPPNYSPEQFASFVSQALLSEQLRVMGGCCGTQPGYIAELCRRLDELTTAGAAS